MFEIGLYHNGASDLPVVATKSGVVVNDGTLAEVQESAQRTLINQIRQGILADQLGFNYGSLISRSSTKRFSSRATSPSTV